MADWFQDLFGFPEQSREQVRSLLFMEGDTTLRSIINGKSYQAGKLDVASLLELRLKAEHLRKLIPDGGTLRVSGVVADVADLHQDPANAGAVFQVASQFNLLEMVSPNVTPDDGVTRYAFDMTQGPACAISAGAATVYRNYFAQSAGNQIDCLEFIHDALSPDGEPLWEMQNGYALPTEETLPLFNRRFAALDEAGREELREMLCVGIHSNVEVTRGNAGHLVHQIFCSALPLAYSRTFTSPEWHEFAQLILDAAYEATLLAAMLISPGNPVYLTQIGGGVFGNRVEWIHASMMRAFDLLKDSGLDVRIVRRQ